jgi:hypothetical protein
MTNIFLTRLKSFKDLERIRSQNKIRFGNHRYYKHEFRIRYFYYKSINQSWANLISIC